jgi:Protein of unknown function (DUF2971)
MPRYRTALENGVNRLYHYQRFDATHLANTIVNGVVRFTRPGDFNDPWDCQPVFSVPKERNEREALARYMARASEKHGTTLCPNEIERRVMMLIENPLKLRAAMDESAPDMYRQLDQRYRIYCLTTKPDCPLMWAHYADHHRGICLEIDSRLPDLCAAIQVQYRETYPTFRLDDDKDLTPFCTKSLDWQYEDEYRLIAEEDVGAFHQATMKTQDQFYKLPQGSLTSIIIGARASEEMRKTISEILERSGRNLLLRQATRAADRYELLIEPPIGAGQSP